MIRGRLRTREMNDEEKKAEIREVFDLCKKELDSQAREVDAIDTKGSILVGTGAALLTLSHAVLRDEPHAWPAALFFGAATLFGIAGVWFRHWLSVPNPAALLHCYFERQSFKEAMEEAAQSTGIAYYVNSVQLYQKIRCFRAGFVLIGYGTLWVCLLLLASVLPRAVAVGARLIVLSLPSALVFSLMKRKRRLVRALGAGPTKPHTVINRQLALLADPAGGSGDDESSRTD